MDYTTDTYEEVEKLIREKEEELKKLKHYYSNSNTQNVIDTNSSSIYIKQISDLHASNTDKLVEEIVDFLKIPGAYIVLDGDLINGDILGKKNVNIYGKIQSPQDELFSVISAIKQGIADSGVDAKKVFVSWVDGNHDLRITDMTSFQPGNLATRILGVPEIYSENLSKVVFKLNDPQDPSKKISCTAIASHGNRMPNNAGNALDISLINNVVKGANLILYAHTHVPACGTMTTKINDKGVEKVVETMAFNPGSEQPRENYVDKNGYRLCGRPDGEIIRIAAVPDEETKETKICVDMINQRDVYDRDNKTWIEIKKVLEKLESVDYDNKIALDNAYKKSLSEISKIVKKGNDEKPKVRSNETALSVLAGFMIGKPTVNNEDKIEKAIKAISVLPNCKVVLNGDMIYYHEATTFRDKTKNRYPEDSFAYIKLITEILEPIKDKIIAYNSGVEETKIMKYHGEELAKLAMNTLQMDEKLVYKPYNKVQYKARVLKFNNQKIELYNKLILKIECETYLDSTANLELFNNYCNEKYGDERLSKSKKSEILKSFVAKQLREQEKFYKDGVNLDEELKTLIRKADLTDKERAKIKKIYEDAENDLRRTPCDNLIQNMVFSILGVNVKRIDINTRYNTQTQSKIKLYTTSGASSPLSITGLYSTSNAGRGAQENNLNRTENTNPGYDIYYVSPKKSCEYLTKGTVAYVNDGKTILKTIYHICTPRFDTNNYVQHSDSENRIYIFKKVQKNKYMLESERTGRSVFVDESEDDFTIIASSVSYNSLLVKNESKISIIKKELTNSYNKKYNELQAKREKVVNNKIFDSFEKGFNEMKETPKSETDTTEKHTSTEEMTF